MKHSEFQQDHFETATAALKHDHRIIERVLRVLTNLVENPDKARLETWGQAVEFIRNFADRCHHLKEEKVLFPALEERGVSVEGGPIGVMLAEHEEGRGYVRAMAAALEVEDTAAAIATLVENAKSYLGLLPEHIRKEDEVLFLMADEALSPEEQKKLLREFEEHEMQEIGAGVHDRYLRLAEELEASVR